MTKRVRVGGDYCDYKCCKEMFAKAKRDIETIKPKVVSVMLITFIELIKNHIIRHTELGH